MLEIMIPAVADRDGPAVRALDFLHYPYGGQDVCGVLSRIRVRWLLKFGLTWDYVLVEEMARKMGVRRVEMFWDDKCQVLNTQCFTFRNMLRSYPERKVEGWAVCNPNRGDGGGAFKVLIEDEESGQE
jgi:hypothetical protein